MNDTTTKNYSLFAMANQALAEARTAKAEAYRRADRNPCPENINAFLQADHAMRTAESNLDQVRSLLKYTRNTQRDGSDNTMRGSLADAGYDGGIF